MFIAALLAMAPLVAPRGPLPSTGITAIQRGACRLELNGKPLTCAVVAYAFAPSTGRTSFNAAIGGDVFGFSGLKLQPDGQATVLTVDTLVAHRQTQSVHEPASGQCSATISPDHDKLLQVSCRISAKSGTWTLAFKADQSRTAFVGAPNGPAGPAHR